MWTFEIRPDEGARDRIVRCCDELLSGGPVGHGLRQEVYQPFICAGLKPAGKVGGQLVDDISPWATSCALFVRAVLAWAGRDTAVAQNGIGIFSLLQASNTSPSWRRASGYSPQPGDAFYVANTGNDGHVGILLREVEAGVWTTAEGGGSIHGASAGTSCSYGHRKIGARFDTWRSLQGFFSADDLGVPSFFHPPPAVAPTPDVESHDDEGKEAVCKAFDEVMSSAPSTEVSEDLQS